MNSNNVRGEMQYRSSDTCIRIPEMRMTVLEKLNVDFLSFEVPPRIKRRGLLVPGTLDKNDRST